MEGNLVRHSVKKLFTILSYACTGKLRPNCSKQRNGRLLSDMATSEWKFPGNVEFTVTPEMKKFYDEQGYIIIRGLVTPPEMKNLKAALEHPDGVRKHAYGLDDGSGQGRMSMLSIWSHPGSDVSGILSRCDKVAGTSGKLLGGDCYHYHSKLIMKEARTGGQFLWHQDYGYWYQNGCLFPHLLTAFVAVDKADRENGCLRVIPGSHIAGRLEHKMTGGQQGADVDRVNELLKLTPELCVEMEAGDCLFFHSNLLHRSFQNDSDRRRWMLTLSYCRNDNNPVYKHHHPQYTPLHIVPNEELETCDNVFDLSGKDFIDPSVDKTVGFDEDKQEGLTK